MSRILILAIALTIPAAALDAEQVGRGRGRVDQQPAQQQVAPMPRDQAEALASRLHPALLGRAATAAERARLTAELQRGGLVTEVNAIVSGAEFRRARQRQNNAQLLEQLYQELLGRAPDSSGVNSALPMLEAGNATDVVVSIVQSDEFRQRLASTTTPAPSATPTRLAAALDCQARALDQARREASGLVFWTFDRMPDTSGNVVSGPAVDRFNDRDRQLTYRCDGNSVTYVYADRGAVTSGDRRLEFPSGAVRACIANVRDDAGRSVTFDAAALTATDTRTEYVIGLAANTSTRYVCEMDGTRVVRADRQ